MKQPYQRYLKAIGRKPVPLHVMARPAPGDRTVEFISGRTLHDGKPKEQVNG